MCHAMDRTQALGHDLCLWVILLIQGRVVQVPGRIAAPRQGGRDLVRGCRGLGLDSGICKAHCSFFCFFLRGVMFLGGRILWFPPRGKKCMCFCEPVFPYVEKTAVSVLCIFVVVFQFGSLPPCPSCIFLLARRLCWGLCRKSPVEKNTIGVCAYLVCSICPRVKKCSLVLPL